jgi:hypothetical protein
MKKANTRIPLFPLPYETGTTVSAAILCDNQFKSFCYQGKGLNRSGDGNFE